jgi:hypothetical protein
MNTKHWIAICISVALARSAAEAAVTTSSRGFAAAEYSYLPGNAGNGQQIEEQFGAKLQWEGSARFSESWQVAARAFVRQDASRSNLDAARLDELWIEYSRPSWDVRLGNQLVTWGSVESLSPLDTVNPRDFAEDILEPTKIGVPALRVRGKFGGDDLSVYWLPYYQSAVLPDRNSRYSFSGGLPIVEPRDRWNPSQWAARYFHTGDGFDVGVSWVHALERTPAFELAPGADALVGTSIASDRYGVDLTWVLGEGVLKSELVYRNADQVGNERTWLYVLGGEYTWSGIWGLSDLTLFVEYLGSSNNPVGRELLQNDGFAAVRWTLNDLRKQQLQAGIFVDMQRTAQRVFRLEYSFSPTEALDIVLRYTGEHDYFSAPRSAASDRPEDGAAHLLFRFNF